VTSQYDRAIKKSNPFTNKGRDKKTKPVEALIPRQEKEEECVRCYPDLPLLLLTLCLPEAQAQLL
jgi:hypothetical protein